MKNILFILLCVFTTQLFSQTTQNTISEEKFGLLSCKNFSKTYIEEDMTYKFVPILLCDDCYTGIRYWIADELDIHVQGVDI